MITGAIDLFEQRFWIVVVAALVLVTPWRAVRARSIAFALANLLMLRLLLGQARIVWLAMFLVVIVLTSVMLRFAERSARPWLWCGGCLTAISATFVGTKLVPFWGQAQASPVWTFLALISFSYVFLRAVELVRAVAERRHPPPGVVDILNYLVPFHMLAAGPIQSYDDFRAGQQIVPSPLTATEALRGVERIAIGLFKKFVIAVLIERLFLTGFRTGGAYFFLEAQLHYLWIYVDFSAYSDIAVGVGTLLGIRTPENFHHPYIARNMIEFWERWHITLSLWLRRNLFYPLQLTLTRFRPDGNPLSSSSVALLVTFGFAGLWHRFNWPFFGWGLMHAVGVVATNVYRDRLQKKLGRKGVKAYLARPSIRALSTVLTFEYVAFSLVIIGYPWSDP